MKSRFRNFFQSPVFDNPDLTRRAQNLRIIIYGLFLATCFWAWYPIFVQGGIQVAVALTVLALEIGVFVLLKTRKVLLAGSLLSSILWIALVVFMASFGGVRNSGFVAFTVVVVIATLTLGARAGHSFAIFTILAGIGLIFAENKGWLPPYTFEPNITVLISQGVNIIGVSLLLSLSMRNVNKSMVSAQENEKAQKEINKLLEASRTELESRTEIMEQRNVLLETVAEVAKLASQTKSETVLIEKATQLLAQKINLEYVNIYFLDQTEENAILQASNTPQDREQLRVHKSEVDYPYLSTDTIRYHIGGYDYHIQRPPLLPETKASYTLPLRSSTQIFGIINVQTISPTPGQFDEQTLQTFADQIALSIENTRLLEQLQTRVREAGMLAEQTSQEAWGRLRGGETLGYNYDRLRVISTKEKFPAEVSEKIKNKQVVAYTTTETPPHAKLVVPIIVRENVIGVIGYEETDPAYTWQENDKTLLETVASRVSLALENSRLVAEAERRANQERAISQAANRMRETLDIDTVLKTATLEIMRTLKAEKTEVRLRVAPDENIPGHSPAEEKQ